MEAKERTCWVKVQVVFLMGQALGASCQSVTWRGDDTGQPLFLEQLSCNKEHIAGTYSNQRNVSTGNIRYHWGYGLVRLDYRLPAAVRRAVTISCSGFRAALLPVLPALRSGAGRSLLLLVGGKLRRVMDRALRTLGFSSADSSNFVADHRKHVVFDGVGNTLSSITATLLLVHGWQMSHIVTSAIGTHALEQLDAALESYFWALYFSQVLEGFFACVERWSRFNTQHMEKWQNDPDDPRSVKHCGVRDFRNDQVGFVFHPEGHFRFQHVSRLLSKFGPAPRLLEVGVNKGDVPYHVLSEHGTASYLGIDPYSEQAGTLRCKRARERLRQFGKRARIFRGTLNKLNATSMPRFHVVYVDGDHEFSAVLHDIRLAPMFLVPGGIIAGHDFLPWYLDVMLAVFRSAVQLEVEVVNLGADMTWWFELPAQTTV